MVIKPPLLIKGISFASLFKKAHFFTPLLLLTISLRNSWALGVPEPDSRIKSPTGEQVSIGGKSQTDGALRVPARPEQGTTLYVPQLDAAIMAPTGERAFVRAEGEG